VVDKANDEACTKKIDFEMTAMGQNQYEEIVGVCRTKMRLEEEALVEEDNRSSKVIRAVQCQVDSEIGTGARSSSFCGERKTMIPEEWTGSEAVE
jgi:hypothetical protein